MQTFPASSTQSRYHLDNESLDTCGRIYAIFSRPAVINATPIAVATSAGRGKRRSIVIATVMIAIAVRFIIPTTSSVRMSVAHQSTQCSPYRMPPRHPSSVHVRQHSR